MIKKGFICLLVLFSCSKVRAQDIHFSQFYAMPIFTNPAFTGYMNGDVRVAADFRMQWETFGSGFGNAFRTVAFASDFGLLRAKTGGSTLGVGVTFMNDHAGDLSLSTNQAGVALSYIQELDRSGNNFLGLGFHGTFNQRSIDLTEAIFPDQFENDIIENKIYFNFSAGLLWFFEPSSNVNFYVGGALHNIIRPNVSFYDGVTEDLDFRYTAQFGSKFDVSKSISLVPSIFFEKQGPSQELLFGTFLKYHIGGYTYYKTTETASFQVGAFYRFADAIIPVVRFDYKAISAIFSYDVNLSKLSVASKGEGAAEISITYTGRMFPDSKKYHQIRCPVL